MKSLAYSYRLTKVLLLFSCLVLFSCKEGTHKASNQFNENSSDSITALSFKNLKIHSGFKAHEIFAKTARTEGEEILRLEKVMVLGGINELTEKNSFMDLSNAKIEFLSGVWDIKARILKIENKLSIDSADYRAALSGDGIILDPGKKILDCSANCFLKSDNFSIKGDRFEINFGGQQKLQGTKVKGVFYIDSK